MLQRLAARVDYYERAVRNGKGSGSGNRQGKPHRPPVGRNSRGYLLPDIHHKVMEQVFQIGPAGQLGEPL